MGQHVEVTDMAFSTEKGQEETHVMLFGYYRGERRSRRLVLEGMKYEIGNASTKPSIGDASIQCNFFPAINI